MKVLWQNDGSMHRARLAEPVKVKLRLMNNEMSTQPIRDLGYITRRENGIPFGGKWVANTYGSINPASPSKDFDDLDEAKRYVEEQATVGLALNKLTR